MNKGRSTEPAVHNNSAFARRVAEIEKNPELLDTKEELVAFWQLALEERNRNKSEQDYLSGVVARMSGFGGTKPKAEIFEDDPYAKIILQFALMDHMHEGYGDEANREWDKLANMLRKLPEYRDPITGK